MDINDDNSYHFIQKLEEGDKAIRLLLPILKKEYNAKFKRYDDGGNVDRDFSIDLKVIFPNKDETWASKTRHKKWHKFNDITMEIMNGNGTRGDYYRFKGGVLQKYIYSYFTNNRMNDLYDIYILNAQRLADIPINLWKGNIEKDFEGIGTIRCYQNNEYGRSWFTAINILDLMKYSVIENVLNRKQITLESFLGKITQTLSYGLFPFKK